MNRTEQNRTEQSKYLLKIIVITVFFVFAFIFTSCLDTDSDDAVDSDNVPEMQTDVDENTDSNEDNSVCVVHNWGNPEVVKAATCTENGSKISVCLVCGDKKTEEILAVGHDFSAEIFSSNLFIYKCSGCNNNIDLSSPIDVNSLQKATSSSVEVYFGIFPKTVLREDESVTVNENEKITIGANTYYKGSDNNWYAKVLENSYSANFWTAYIYSDGTIVKWKDEQSYRYFKVEPIKWRVLSTNYNGRALLHAAEILTANVPYYNFNDDYTRTVGMDSSIYPTNYKYSQVRAWLNGLDYYYDTSSTQTDRREDYKDKGFLQTAFTDAAINRIENTEVDNSVESTVCEQNPYACSNTQDKIFLLSKKEATAYAYFADDSSRVRKITDYAKANYAMQITNGLVFIGGYWWLRSQDSFCRFDACYVNCDGDIRLCGVGAMNRGILPALSIAFY